MCVCVEGVWGGCSGTCLLSSLPWVPLRWQSRGSSGSWEPNFSVYPQIWCGGSMGGWRSWGGRESERREGRQHVPHFPIHGPRNGSLQSWTLNCTNPVIRQWAEDNLWAPRAEARWGRGGCGGRLVKWKGVCHVSALVSPVTFFRSCYVQALALSSKWSNQEPERAKKQAIIWEVISDSTHHCCRGAAACSACRCWSFLPSAPWKGEDRHRDKCRACS